MTNSKSATNKRKPKPARPSSQTRVAGSARLGRARTEELRGLLQMAQIRAEKCELKEARENYQQVLEVAKKESELRTMMEALAGLLRLASEAMDEDGMRKLESELDTMMARHPGQVPPMAWYCKGVIARHRNDTRLAQRHVQRYLRAIRREGPGKKTSNVSSARHSDYDESVARGWVMLAIILCQRGRLRRSLHLAQVLLSKYEERELRGVNGMLYHLLGGIHERQRDLESALRWYQKAHSAFLGEHSWYYHLYVLYAYARLARLQQNYPMAYWYLDLIEKAVTRPEFGLLRREILMEKSHLESDAVDLLVDSRQCVVQTREGGQISLRKQYVLLHILEALSQAHQGSEVDRERGLSKAEIIEKVWKEQYGPKRMTTNFITTSTGSVSFSSRMCTSRSIF